MQQSGKDTASSVAKKAQLQSENHQLSNPNAETEQSFNSDIIEETAYNAADRHMTYHKTRYSYNEQRSQYAEQAFNDREAPENGQPPPNPSGGLLTGTSVKYNGISRTAETPELWENTNKLFKNEELRNKLDDKRKYVQRGYTRLTLKIGEKEISTKRRLIFSHYNIKTRLNANEDKIDLHRIGKIKYEGMVISGKMTRKDYNDWIKEKGKRSFRRRAAGRLLYSKGHSLLDNETIAEDEDIAAAKRTTRRAVRAAAMSTRNNIKTLRLQNNVYAGFEQANMHGQVLQHKRERLFPGSDSAMQKQKLKKKMVQQRAREEENFFHRSKHQFLVKKTSHEYRRRVVKRTLSTIWSAAVLTVLAIISLMCLLLLVLAITQGGTEYYAAAVTQNDYSTLSDATAYFRKLETDLDEYLNADRDALEAELEAGYGPDIYEYIYSLAEFGFSANTLIAYLSAVYGEFHLEGIQDELNGIFGEMYTLTVEVKTEDRDIEKQNPDTGEYYTVTEPKKICYVTLEKKELEEVIEARLPGELDFQYNAYKLSTGGQQVYAPVMREDWTALISSNYGERIHPITKARTFHKGIDIAVPEGTKLYSAVKGVVVKSQYSESAGNYVTVQTDSGWTVTFMHMNERAVSSGQQLEQGDFVGFSGNTGNSTGPHLHLQVEDADGNTVNPIFIIPQTCAVREEREESLQ